MLCSCRVLPCRPRSWHGCWIRAVLLPYPGCHDPASRAGLCSGFHVRGKQLGFHLSRFMNKFMRSRSSWLGLLSHASWTLVPTASITRVLWVGKGQHGKMLCPPGKVWAGGDALVSQVKGSPPTKTLSCLCTPQRSGGWLQAAALPLPGASPALKSLHPTKDGGSNKR